MGVEDFNAAVRPKFDGTVHLNEAFKGPFLDFFIMLSSVSNILGSRSQANYAAGNAFQDEFASSQIECKTHYLSLNLGLIGDSKIMNLNPELRKNAIQEGAIPLDLKQLFSLLGYAMSAHAQARVDKATQIALGFDRKSITESRRSGLLDNPMFNHLVYESEKVDLEPAVKESITVDEAMNAAVNEEEKYSIIISAVKGQLSSLLSIDAENIDVDSPMENLGLDSLIAIELKAWISRSLQASIQTSEILDTPNIRSLVTAVAKRSTFFTSYRIPQNGSIEGRETSEIQNLASINGQAPRDTNLPQPPLADIESSLQFYLYSIRAFCSEKQLRKTTTAIQDFQKPGGLGSKLQNRLLERANKPGVDSWLYELYNNHVYLKQRAPVSPWGFFFGSHPSSKTSHGQAERAAIISETTFRFKQQLEVGEIEPDLLNEQPLCMNTLQWLFNSIREPRTSVDTMHKFPSHDYLVAMRHGHFFKIALKKGQERVSYLNLKATFQAILDRGLEYGPSIAALTADDRDSWAKVTNLSSLMMSSEAKYIGPRYCEGISPRERLLDTNDRGCSIHCMSR